MKPAPFDYCCPDSVDEAIAALAACRGDAKLMAGGQSLMPMLNFRVVRPALIVDIRKLVELDYVREREDGGLAVGALTRHRVLETSRQVARHFPIIPDTMRHVAHLAIRNRGTIGGSLSHADPAAELPMLARLLDATIVTRSPRGERRIAAADFFIAPLTTMLDDDEMVVRVDFPGVKPGTGWCFEEFSRRAGDFALAAVGVLLDVRDGVIHDARVAMMGVGDTPLRRSDSEAILLGKPLCDALVDEAAEIACDGLSPAMDLHASPAYRRHLAGVLARRAIRSAWRRASGVAQ
ncbi:MULTISPECIES: FAD binding domain-containing protein [Burkholderia]|uniref:FAD binding domain-containing protein n=1 Tax=Burkholderia TaxID=32008 RepID=UPI0006799A8B|nr:MULTISPECIES: xanthine dehydrogenase family protein subunit M [Burkholderia]KWU25085.1 carbon monoxide dehydrogenase [Burkholderia cenocepacia]OXI70756.1 carbon monoxide dehydrogenase [Burkholderia sp. AU31280]QRR17422.1 xanthine dehydrogenase family protein subunit M [Burkholderia sp. MS389]RQU29713.1 xanthine dehydrogenase family protein subunit M [Burkholderia cenocepacia]RQV66124.1 xanthine dehydrogenase family protein subunit M [Burkholderia cenocepacia]